MKSEAKMSDDIFDGISIYREVTDLNWLAILREVEHSVPTRDLVRIVTERLQLDESIKTNVVGDLQSY